MMRRYLPVLLGMVLPLGALLAGSPRPAEAQEISARAADIRIGGRLHAQYAASSVAEAENDFFFRRVRLIADVDVTDFFSARLQPDFSGGETQLQDAYVRFNFSPAFRVSMGQFKRAYDLFELSSSTELGVIERDGRVEGVGGCAGVGGACSYSRLTEKLEFAGRDQGVRIDGSQGSLSYQATVTNGTGINTSDENDAKSYAGRLTLEAAPGLSISGQLGLHDYLGADESNEYATAWGVDVELGSWRDALHVQAAVAGGQNWKDPDTAGEAPQFLTLQGIVSYYNPLEGGRLAGWEPLVRVSWADPNGDAEEDGGFVFTPGLMLYVSGRNRIGVNLDVYSPQTGDTEYSFKVQSFLYF